MSFLRPWFFRALPIAGRAKAMLGKCRRARATICRRAAARTVDGLVRSRANSSSARRAQKQRRPRHLTSPTGGSVVFADAAKQSAAKHTGVLASRGAGLSGATNDRRLFQARANSSSARRAQAARGKTLTAMQGVDVVQKRKFARSRNCAVCRASFRTKFFVSGVTLRDSGMSTTFDSLSIGLTYRCGRE